MPENLVALAFPNKQKLGAALITKYLPTTTWSSVTSSTPVLFSKNIMQPHM